MTDVGFISLQVRLRDVAITSSRPDFDAVKEDLRQVGFTPLEIETVIEKAKTTLLTDDVVITAGQKGVENARKGFPAKSVTEEGPNCGHGVPTIKRLSKGKEWWACQAKDAKGNYLWKNKEGCEWVPVA
jgi:hypothetical protein